MNASKPLTPKQERFVQEYLVDCNGTQAAIRAGYSKRTARVIAAENLTKPNVQQAVAEAQQRLAVKTGLDAVWVLERLQEHRAGAVADKQFASANRAVELIGQHLGMFKNDDKAPVPGDTYNTVALQGFSLEELRELLGKMPGARRSDVIPSTP